MHERLQRDRLPIPWRSVEDQAAFPRHSKFAVLGLRVEEAKHRTRQRLLHFVIEYDIVPVRLLHFVIEAVAAVPVAVVDENGVLDSRLPRGRNRAQERVCCFGVGEDSFVVLRC